jgi:hypothetical protein
MPARDGTYAGSAVVSVDRTDPETVEIPISRVLSVEGQVESAGNPGSLTVTVHPDAASGAGVTLSSPVRSTGKFILAPIMRERYSIRVGGLQDDAYLARVQINGKDMLPTEVDFPAEPDAANLVLTVNPDGGRVSGAGERPESTVVLAPDVRTRTDLFKTARTNAKGEFEIRGIAPGNYTLFVLKDAAAGAWEDAEFMKRFEGSGRRVVITSGARITLDSR